MHNYFVIKFSLRDMQKSDQLIKKDIVDQLYWNSSVDATNIKVEVDEGNVQLTGTVPSYKNREIASNTCEAILGVKNIDNFITVEYPIDVPTDKEIRNKIQDNILWNPYLKESDIDVKVKNQQVKLKGYVSLYWEKNKAEELADIRGVQEINNLITVVPTKKLSDEVIADDIVNSLSRRSDINTGSTDIKVKDGKVIISGRVSSWREFRAVEETAFLTKNVVSVENNLLIG